MAEQLALGVEAPADQGGNTRPLSPRQQLAYDYVREHDGVSVDEVGAFLHAHRDRRPHGVDERCEWCARDGRGVLTSKAVAPLVRYRMGGGRGRLYVAKDPAAREPSHRPGVIATSEPDPALNPFADL